MFNKAINQEANLEIYNRLKSVPKEFLKEIKAGRLAGMSDIKPQWRVMQLTELFGACGFGWKVQNVQFEYKETSNNEIVVNCRLEFLYKVDDIWSEPIPATGGSKLATWENKKDFETQVRSKELYVSDEAEKMAYTDALSVAGKMIGLASDIYMGYGGKYDTKYTNIPPTNKNNSQGQNMANKKWFNIKTLDGKPIEANIKQVEALKVKYNTTDEIVKYIEAKGYGVSKETKAQIEIILNT